MGRFIKGYRESANRATGRRVMEGASSASPDRTSRPAGLISGPGPQDAAPFTISPPGRRARSPRRHRPRDHPEGMGDFLVIVAIAVFVLVMLGLIRGLDRI
jgi:hypothetical protein